jgi:uncharacterized protein YrrD
VPDPVSYLLVERGWDVVASDGSHLGSVDDVIADEEKDIFNGLVVTAGLFRGTKYVPSERVSTIVEGRVALDVDVDGFRLLGEHTT